MVGRGMVNDQVDNDLQPSFVGLIEQFLKILHRPVIGMDAGKIRNVISIVFQRGLVKGKQGNSGDAKVFQLIQFLDQPGNIADAAAGAIVIGTDVQGVNDAVFIPVGVGLFGHVRFVLSLVVPGCVLYLLKKTKIYPDNKLKCPYIFIGVSFGFPPGKGRGEAEAGKKVLWLNLIICLKPCGLYPSTGNPLKRVNMARKGL